MTALLLPHRDGTVRPWAPTAPDTTDTASAATPAAGRSGARTAYAAVHVVADPLADVDPADAVRVDWDATLAFREHIWSCGLGVAEAMDTAQRGMGLDWTTTRELIRRTGELARPTAAPWCAGVGTDHLPPGPASLDQVVSGWLHQLDVVVEAGAVPVVMASRALAAAASSPQDYRDAYGALLSRSPVPVLLHWLGEPFDPALAGYWGHRDLGAAAAELAALCAGHADKVVGVKVSVLDADVEIAFRRALPDGVSCYTGDDFDYPVLIEGDEQGHSEALLGIFDAIAPVAGAALSALEAGDTAAYSRLMDPTVALSREIFRAPTRLYKVGVVFLAYLAGHQNHFRMVGGLESARSVVHLSELLRLADTAGVLPDPDLAVARMRPILAAAGIR